MTFGGGTTVGSARYEVSLDAQAMLQAMAHLEQTTRESSNTVVAALTRIEGENKQVGQASEQMAATVRRSTDEINTATKRASDAHHDFGSILKETTERSLTFFGVGGALELGKKAFEGITTATKEAQQAQFQLNALYRDSAQDVARFSEQLAAATGRSNTEAKEAVATFATLVRNYGFTSEQVKILTERTADLAAVSGLTFKEAADAVQSAMRGEAEHAERLGLTLNRNAIVAMAQLTDEQKKNYNSLDQLTQAGIIYNEFLRQSSFAQGEAQKRLETAPGAADKLAASMTNLGVRIGEVTGGTGAMQRNLANFIDFVASSIKPLDDLSKAILAIQQAPFNFGFNLGRQLAGQPTLEQEAAQAAEQARATAEQAPPAVTIESLGDPARAAAAKAERDRVNKEIAKDIEDNLKKRGEAVKDEAQREIDSLKEQEQAAQKTYDAQRKAYEDAKNARTRANDAWHRDALDKLKVEEDATKASYDAQIRAAEIAKDRRIAANDESHKATLAQIDAERKAAEEASKGRVVDLEVARDAAFGDVNTVKEQQLAILQAQQEAAREARTQEDRDRADARQQEDRDAAGAHQAEIDRLKAEHDAAVEGFKDRRAEIERTKQAALEAIQSETDKEAQQHEQALAHLQAEQQAAQATHDQAARSLEDQGRVLQAQHDAALKTIQAEQQAAQDAHDLRIRQLQDEQSAEEQASQVRQAALRAENDELSRQHAQRLSEIDAEAKAEQAALQQQLSALQQQQQGDTFATQQAGLEQKVAQAQTGLQIAQEIATNTGDPNTVLAARKALADAQAALDKANADRAVQVQRDAIQQQISDLRDQVDAKKQAENEQYQAEKDRITAEIADEQKHLQTVKDAIAQQIQAANDELVAVKRVFQQEQEAENAAFQQRVAHINAEKQANDDRLAAELATLAKERDAENNRQKEFAANEASKRKAAEQTATAALGNLQSQSDAEQKAYATSTATVNTRYQTEQQRIADTRRVQDRAIADNRTAEDRDLATHRQAVEDTAKHDHEKIDDLYNNPKTGLIQIEKNALTETLTDFDLRKTKADEVYGDEQTQIKATFDDKETGLIPKLQHAKDEQEKQYALRRTDIDTTYQHEKDAIYDTFDNPDPPDGKGGLIPKLQKAYEQTRDRLADQVKVWQQWAIDVNKEIASAISNLQTLIDKVQEINKIGGTVVRDTAEPVPGQAQGNLPGETSEERHAREEAANQAAIDAAKQAGGRGLYGGSPLSVAQFGPGSAALRTEFGNSNVDAMCGPISAEALARLAGNPQDMATILAWAKSHGYWNPNDGITNSGFGPIADHFGVHTSISGNKQAAIDAIARGEPAVFNTAHHYMLAQGYDPSSGLFDLGYTGETVYNQRYMTFEQLSARGGGFRNIYVADGVNLFGGGSTPAPPSVQKQTISIPSLGLNFEISAPVGAAPPSAPTGAPLEGTYPDMARQAAQRYGFPAEVFVRQMAQESGNFAADVISGARHSPAGAVGIAQFMPATSAGLGINPLDVPQALDAAAHMMENYLKQYGDIRVALAAYNAGPGNVAKYGGVPPFAETQSYVRTIMGFANGGIIPEPTALVSLRNYQPYAIAGEVGPERVVPMGGSRAMGEQIVHNYYGVAPESIVRDLMTAQRRERMLRGRY
jgi:hypothetical protein